MSELLEDLTSRDPMRVWSSSSAVVTLRDKDELDLLSARVQIITERTANLDLGGALFPNNERLSFAIRKLQYYRDSIGCLCRLYPEYIMYDPRREETDGNVKILESQSDTDAWSTTYTCQCTICGTLYAVEEGESHYTWWSWKVKEQA